MAEFPALPLWTDAYLADTRHLSTTEHGAYLLLLMAMWRNGGILQDDEVKIRKITGLTKAQWARSKPAIYEFLMVENGQLSQCRLTDELNYVRTKTKKASDSARAKWRKHKESGHANAYTKQCETDAPTPTPTPTPTKKDIPIANAIGRSAPSDIMLSLIDYRHALFNDCLDWLAEQEGKPPDRLRSLVGRWLKLTGDDAQVVVQLVDQAKAERKASPVEWISACLQEKRTATNKYGSGIFGAIAKEAANG